MPCKTTKNTCCSFNLNPPPKPASLAVAWPGGTFADLSVIRGQACWAIFRIAKLFAIRFAERQAKQCGQPTTSHVSLPSGTGMAVRSCCAGPRPLKHSRPALDQLPGPDVATAIFPRPVDMTDLACWIAAPFYPPFHDSRRKHAHNAFP